MLYKITKVILYVVIKAFTAESICTYIAIAIFHVWFRMMKVTLKCNHNLADPKFTADGESVELQYVSHVYTLHSYIAN